MDIDWDERSLEEVARVFGEKHLGGRAVNAMMKDVRYELIKNIRSSKDYVKKLMIKYNKAIEEVFVESSNDS